MIEVWSKWDATYQRCGTTGYCQQWAREHKSCPVDRPRSVARSPYQYCQPPIDRKRLCHVMRKQFRRPEMAMSDSGRDRWRSTVPQRYRVSARSGLNVERWWVGLDASSSWIEVSNFSVCFRDKPRGRDVLVLDWTTWLWRSTEVLDVRPGRAQLRRQRSWDKDWVGRLNTQSSEIWLPQFNGERLERIELHKPASWRRLIASRLRQCQTHRGPIVGGHDEHVLDEVVACPVERHRRHDVELVDIRQRPQQNRMSTCWGTRQPVDTGQLYVQAIYDHSYSCNTIIAEMLLDATCLHLSVSWSVIL